MTSLVGQEEISAFLQRKLPGFFHSSKIKRSKLNCGESWKTIPCYLFGSSQPNVSWQICWPWLLSGNEVEFSSLQTRDRFSSICSELQTNRLATRWLCAGSLAYIITNIHTITYIHSHSINIHFSINKDFRFRYSSHATIVYLSLPKIEQKFALMRKVLSIGFTLAKHGRAWHGTIQYLTVFRAFSFSLDQTHISGSDTWKMVSP